MCFSLGFFAALLIWLVVIVAVVALVRLFVPWILSKLGSDSGVVIAAVNIILWAFVAILIIKVAFMFIGCLPGDFTSMPTYHK